MTQEQKDLLLKDLCARLPYNIKVYDEIVGEYYKYMFKCRKCGKIVWTDSF